MTRRGVTLVELVTVLAILGIIIYIISFNNNIDTYVTLQNEFFSIKDDINYIQKQSMYSNERLKVRFYNNQNYYEVETLDQNQKQITKTLYLNSKVILKDETAYYHNIEFTRSGTISIGAGTFYLQYKNAKYEFTVLPSTGFVNAKD